MCQHGEHLKRHQRHWLQKLIGIEEIYICQNCGYKLTLR